MRAVLAYLVLALVTRFVTCNYYLYVWTGSVGNGRKDFIATVDLVSASVTYGKIIANTSTPYTACEAHHVGLVRNGTVLAAGSYLDFALKGIPNVYFFNISNPARPKFIRAMSTKQSSAADTFVAIPGGGFLASMMGNKKGGTPGRIARFDSNLKLVAEYGNGKKFKSKKTFNPHGIAVSTQHGVFISADFYDPISAYVKKKGDVKFRSSVRLWNLTTFELIKVFDVGSKAAIGFMDAKFLGSKPYGMFGNGLGDMYLLDASKLTFTKVFSFPKAFLPTGTCVTVPIRNTTRTVVSVFGTARMALLDTEDPFNPKLLSTYALPKRAQPHAMVASQDGYVIAVTCYFLDRPNISKLVLPGDRTLRFFTIENDKIIPHPKLDTINFDKVYGKHTNPHGMVLLPVAK